MSTIGAPLSPILPEGLMDRIQEQVQTAKKKRQQEESSGIETPKGGYAQMCTATANAAQQTDPVESTTPDVQNIAIQTENLSANTADVEIQTEPIQFQQSGSPTVEDELRAELESVRAYQKKTQSDMTALSASAAKAQEKLKEECKILRILSLLGLLRAIRDGTSSTRGEVDASGFGVACGLGGSHDR